VKSVQNDQSGGSDATSPAHDLSDTCDELPHRLLQRVGLVPGESLGIARRALVFAAVAWLPVAVWAWISGRLLLDAPGEPLLQHFGIHARCLGAIPLLIVAEATARRMGTGMVGALLGRGIVPPGEVARFEAILGDHLKLRRGALPWTIVMGMVVAWSVVGPTVADSHEILFAAGASEPDPRFTFGAWWYLHVSRAIFFALVLAWLWRLGLLTWTLSRIARLGLSLVPTHPDRMLGLGFLERLPAAYWPVVLALSVVLASHWAHQVVYHGADVRSFAMPLGIFAAIVGAVMLAPLLVFGRPMSKARLEAISQYGALVARHGRLVRERWILGRDPAGTEILEAQELGPVADTVALYEVVVSSRPVPIGRRSMMAVAIPLAIPMVVVTAIQIPLKQLLGNLLKAFL